MMQDNADLLALVRTIPDFPKPGIQFRDITTLIHNGWGLRTAIDRLATASAPYQPTLVAGTPARGFILYRKSVVQGKSVSVRVDLGGRLFIKNKITYLRISAPS